MGNTSQLTTDGFDVCTHDGLVHIPQPQKAGSDAVIVSPFSVDEAEVERQLRLEAVERSAERKVLWRLLPCLFLFSLLNYIDRANLAFASIPLMKDLGFNTEVFGLASGVFFATYAGLQIPAQLLAVRLGGPRILGLLAVSWGLIASAMALVRNESGLLAQRILLGAAEAGALPAMWMVNSQWFPTYRLTIPSTCVMMAITVAQAIAGPMSAGLLALHGRLGPMSGWQLMFLVEGAPAIVLGVCIWLFLPRTLSDASFLTDEEKSAWQAAIEATDSASKHGEDGNWSALKSALTCKVVYCAGTWRGFYATALYGVMYFSPLVIRAILGKPDASGSEVALLTAIPFVAGAAVHSINALHSSRTGERRVHIAAPWIFGGVCMALVPAVYMNAKAAFALYILASAGIYSADGPDVSWVTSLMTGKQRALGLATVNMLANIGGFVGPYVMGALSTATGSFNGPMWFVAGCILIAGTLVALFPLKWGPHNDAPIIQARTASSLQLRQLSRQLTASRCAAASHYVSGSRRASIIGMLPSAIMVQPEGSDCQRGSKPSVISGRKGSVGGQGSVRGATVDGQLPYVRQTTAQEGTVEPQQPQGPDSV